MENKLFTFSLLSLIELDRTRLMEFELDSNSITPSLKSIELDCTMLELDQARNPMFGFESSSSHTFEFELNQTSSSSLDFESSLILSSSNGLGLGHVYLQLTIKMFVC